MSLIYERLNAATNVFILLLTCVFVCVNGGLLGALSWPQQELPELTLTFPPSTSAIKSVW